MLTNQGLDKTVIKLNYYDEYAEELKMSRSLVT